MLIIGGTFPNALDCDAPNVMGTHNMNLGANGPAHSLWDSCDPNITSYDVSPVIVSQIGSGTCGATVTSPSEGKWDNPDLEVYFTRIASVTARTPTRAIPTVTGAPRSGVFTGKKKVGTVIGVTLGGLLFLALLLFLILFFLKCLKRRRSKRALNGPPAELENMTPPTELSSSEPKYLVSGYSPHSSPPQSQGYFHNQENASPREQQGFQVYEMGGGPASRKASTTGFGDFHSEPYPASRSDLHPGTRGVPSPAAETGAMMGSTTRMGSAGSKSQGYNPNTYTSPINPPAGVFPMGPHYACQESVESPSSKSLRSGRGERRMRSS